MEGCASFLLSFIARFSVKVVTDFTGIVQFRHPNEVGGAQWLLGQVTSIIILLTALHVSEVNEIISSERIKGLWRMGFALTGAATVLFTIFFK